MTAGTNGHSVGSMAVTPHGRMWQRVPGSVCTAGAGQGPHWLWRWEGSGISHDDRGVSAAHADPGASWGDLRGCAHEASPLPPSPPEPARLPWRATGAGCQVVS